MKILFCILFCSAAAYGQVLQPPSDWAAVQQIKVGREIGVQTKDAFVLCRFVAASSDGLTCDGIAYGRWLQSSPSGPQQLFRAEVVSVKPRRNHVGKWIARFFAGAGFIFGAAKSDNFGDGIVVGAVAGGLSYLLGYVVGSVVDSFADALPIDPIYQRP